MTGDEEDADFPEQKAIKEARAAAKIVIDRTMLQGMFRTYQLLLDEIESGEQHRFAPIIDWGLKTLGEVPLKSSFSVSRVTIKRWIEGETTPGPMARAAILDRLRELVKREILLL